MLSNTSLKFSALAFGLMLMVGCQSLSTAPSSESSSAKKPAETTVTTPSERAQTSTQQQAEDAMITVHLAQLQNGPELLTVDLGDDKKLYALPLPVLNRGDMEGVEAFATKDGKTFIVFDMTEQGRTKLAELTAKAKGHFFLFGAQGQMIGISQITEPMADGKLVMPTQDKEHTVQVMELLR
ncbi:MAG TPA: hypothetical protein DCF43_11920 [Pseudomonas sp.]|nr:hypothetical protein [Pseudomonas sp.]